MAHSDISDDESEYQSNDNAGNDPDCRKGVPYIIIPWSHHPKYDRRLLEWLKENEIARRALFRKGTHVSNREKERLGGGNKSEFSYQAGIYVLSQDEDPLIRKKIKELEKRQIVKAVGGHILQWRREYKAVNEKLGRKVSNLTYDEIVASVDKDEIRVIDEKIGRFSLWKELHVFFRTNPWANQYHPADVRATKTQSASASPSNTVTEPYVVVNTRKDIIDVDRLFPDTGAPKKEEPSEHVYNFRRPAVQPRRSNAEGSKTAHASKTSKRARNTGDPEGDTLSTTKRLRHTASESTANLFEHPTMSASAAVQLTATQIHEQTMARLEIERLDRENRRLELETKNQRAKESILRRKTMLLAAKGGLEFADYEDI